MKVKDLKLPLKGSCHCGVIKFQVNISLKDLRRCNCSICSRKGFVMGSAPVDLFTIISGKIKMRDGKILGEPEGTPLKFS